MSHKKIIILALLKYEKKFNFKFSVPFESFLFTAFLLIISILILSHYHLLHYTFTFWMYQKRQQHT